MKVAVAQFTPIHRDVAANKTRMEHIIAETRADLIVFPELSLSGYVFENATAISPYSQTREELSNWISQIADYHQCMVIFGFSEKYGSELFNSAAIVQPGKSISIYRKTHLFFQERHCFSPGNSGFIVVEHFSTGAKVGCMICYDWRFPESARTLALAGADLIAAPSNLITETWPLVMPARAVENRVFLAVANRAGQESIRMESGEDWTVAFNGKSCLISPNGEKIIEMQLENARYEIAEIEFTISRNKQVNSINDIFEDRRPEYYGTIIRPHESNH